MLKAILKFIRNFFKKDCCKIIGLFFFLLLAFENCFSQTICIQFFNEAYTGGNQPRSITCADFNHDGHIDLATGNFENSTVSILLGDGFGFFAAPVNYSCGQYPNDIATADLNDDANPDIVTANQAAGSVSVFLGNSNGTFADSVNYHTDNYVDAVTIEDVTNDSIPDILTANESGTIACLNGNGNGTFQPVINSPAPGGISSVAVADFNHDGFKDVVYCHVLGFGEIIHYFCIQFGDGTGAFSNETRTDSIRYPFDAIGADVNNDGFADVITADFFDDTASVYYGIGDGTFDAAIGYPAYLVPDAIALADMNNDNIPEILVADYGSNGVAVLPGHGDGTFGNYVQSLAAVDPQSLTVGDFNEDGLPDIATATTYFGSAYYAIVLNCTATGIETPDHSSLSIYPNPANDMIAIRFKNLANEKVDCIITTVLGRESFHQESRIENNLLQMNLSCLPPGNYFLKIISGDETFVSKIVKQ